MRFKFTLLLLFLAASCSGMLLYAESASAQMGPDLRPPGLPASHPLDAYTDSDRAHNFAGASEWNLDTSDVVFSAAKKRQLISEAPSTIHVITARDISIHGWRTLAEILRHVPGVQTQTTQSQFQSVMIRGLVGTESNNSRILWLQNGVPMNDVRDSGIWLDETYPVELIKRIEVVLGPGSALYGSGAFQGVVNIFTKDPADINEIGEYRLGIQNNLTFKASAIAAHTFDNGIGLLGHVSAMTTEGPGLIGDYVYRNYLMDQAANSTSHGEDYNFIRREYIDDNSHKRSYALNFKLSFDSFKWNIGFTDIYAGADGSEIVPGVSYTPPAKEDEGSRNDDESSGQILFKGVSSMSNHSFDRREFYTDLIYEKSFLDTLSVLGVLSYRLIQYRNKHYAGYKDDDSLYDVGVCQGDDSSCVSAYKGKINYNTLQHKLYALGQVQWRIYEQNELIGGLVLEYHAIDNPEFIHGYNLNSHTYIDAQKVDYLTPSAFIQDEQRFWDNRIILTAGARIDVYKATSKEVRAAPSWRIAGIAKFNEWMTMRLSYGHAFKMPSLYQLYADTFDYLGDPKLEPEELENVELAFLFTPLYNMKIRLDTFYTHMSNLIITRFDSSLQEITNGIVGKYAPKQDADANLFGFELSLDSRVNQNWNLYAHYNFLYSKLVRDSSVDNFDKDIPDDAMHRIKLGASYTNDILTADMAMFIVTGTKETQSSFISTSTGSASSNSTSSADSAANILRKYSTPTYAIFQPKVTIALPANLGLMFQASLAFSENMTKSPTYYYYYEKEGIPVNRYAFMLSLQYPFLN